MIILPDSHDLISFAHDLCGRHFSPGIDNVSAQNNLNDTLLNSRVIVDIIEKAEYKPMPALLFSVVNKKEKNVNWQDSPREIQLFSRLRRKSCLTG